MTDERPSWQSLYEAGYEIGEAAKARKCSLPSAYNWEYRTNQRFRRKSKDEVSRQMSASRHARLAIPANREKTTAIARSTAAVLANLDEGERARYRMVRQIGLTRREALSAIKRDDLLPLVQP